VTLKLIIQDYTKMQAKLKAFTSEKTTTKKQVPTMEVQEAIKGRRSIRKFKKQSIPETTITQLLEAASYAPSAGNIQPWEFVIVRNPTIKKKLAEAAQNQAYVEEAPTIIVVCADEKRASLGYGTRGRTLYCLQDTAAATQNILLTAHSLGLGTCWIGSFNEDEAKEALNAPEGIRPVAMIPLGYPDETPRHRSRKLLSQVTRYDRFLPAPNRKRFFFKK
jgi:nitroreductase